jgi:hypothetical protein
MMAGGTLTMGIAAAAALLLASEHEGVAESLAQAEDAGDVEREPPRALTRRETRVLGLHGVPESLAPLDRPQGRGVQAVRTADVLADERPQSRSRCDR